MTSLILLDLLVRSMILHPEENTEAKSKAIVMVAFSHGMDQCLQLQGCRDG